MAVTSELNKSLSCPISTKTVRRELYAEGYHGRIAVKKPFLSARNIYKRKTWCIFHSNWTSREWQKVVYSDESTFSLQKKAGKTIVWRQPHEKLNAQQFFPLLLMVVALLHCVVTILYQYENTYIWSSF